METLIYCLAYLNLWSSALVLVVLFASVPYAIGRASGRRAARREMVDASTRDAVGFELWLASEKVARSSASIRSLARGIRHARLRWLSHRAVQSVP